MSEKTELQCNYAVIEEHNKKPGFGIRHLQCAMMCICVTSLYIIRSSMGIAVLAMTDQTKLNDTNIDIYQWDEKIQGIVLSSFFWGYTIMQVPGGIIATRFGGKRILLAALIINGLLCLLVPILAKLGGWQAVCAVRLCMGLSQSCLFPACHTLLGKWIPEEERTRLSTAVYSGVPLGTIISMPLCGVLSKTALGWKTIFYGMSGLSLSSAIVWSTLSASSPEEHKLIKENEKTYILESLASPENQSSMSIPWKTFFTSVPVLALTCVHVGVNWVFVLFFVQMPKYMKSVLGINIHNSATLSALPYIAMWLISIVASNICEHIYNRKILSLSASRKLFNSIGCFGSAISLAVLSFMTTEHSTVAILMLTVTIGVLSFPTSSGFMLNHLDLSPTFAGVLLGVTNCISNAVGALAPILTGYLLGDDATDPSRWRWVFFLAAGLISVSNIIFVIFGTSERQTWDDPANETNKNQIELLETAALKAESLYKFDDNK